MGRGGVDSGNRVFITFLTDFGLQDDFVGTCHGVIKRLAPDAADHRHHARDSAPGGAAGGARARQHAAVHARGGAPRGGRPGRGRVTGGPSRCATPKAGSIVGPDNGLLLPAAERAGITDAQELANPAYALESISRTFHGRDLFAPAAAHLARGVPLAELGPPIDPGRARPARPARAVVRRGGRPRDDAVRRQLRQHRPQPDARRSRAGRGRPGDAGRAGAVAESATTPSRPGRSPMPGRAT